jgi:hypothetical protein
MFMYDFSDVDPDIPYCVRCKRSHSLSETPGWPDRPVIRLSLLRRPVEDAVRFNTLNGVAMPGGEQLTLGL